MCSLSYFYLSDLEILLFFKNLSDKTNILNKYYQRVNKLKKSEKDLYIFYKPGDGYYCAFLRHVQIENFSKIKIIFLTEVCTRWDCK